VTEKVLWSDDWSTPTWVKAMLKLMTLSKFPSHVGYRMIDIQENVLPNRYWHELEICLFVPGKFSTL